MTCENEKIGIGWNHAIKRSSSTRIGFEVTVYHPALRGFMPSSRKLSNKSVYSVDNSVDNIKINRISRWISLK